jgi:ABC-type Fe3+/spermidine/putrescine transport system ATPase subunit
MVFQSYALWPHMSVGENVRYPLSIAGVARADAEKNVQGALELVHLSRLAGRMPHQLSGGQQQRVALARALVRAPRVLLLDEPLSNLDARLREEMRFEIRELKERLGITVICVTHDQSEAFAMSDRIVLMNQGRIVQSGPPGELYRRPADAFVAGFLGVANLVEARWVAPGRARVDAWAGAPEVPVVSGRAGGAGADGPVRLAIRPEAVELRARARAAPEVAAVVERAAFQGDRIEYRVLCGSGGGGAASLRASALPPAAFGPGDQVTLVLREAAAID